ncbi:hypothetical protein AM592_13980 [Bacillus gobiensis]|uniref:HPP transmembrane region domain-containing protein n=3 Tax=Bacillaceae TaxID=186817 RepID=A0A0M4FI71_9BACI|nr:hypothetical protein AM592_13980 [Bacillus gobiensis]MBP1081482.1 CBS-domain-containing membrane protein [Bacillus capparidis]
MNEDQTKVIKSRGSFFSRYLSKMKTKERTPMKALPENAVMGFLGGFLTIFVLMALSKFSGNTWIMAPFGASCVLAFSAWNVPFSQPRNIIGGHMISTLVGLIILSTIGDSLWAVALAVGLAIALMVITKTTHPPAGADPLVVILSKSQWSFLWFPSLFGALATVVIALIINNLHKERKYPTFWY